MVRRKTVWIGIAMLGALLAATGLASHADDLTLSEGLQQTMTVVDTTAAAVASDRPLRPEPDNADPSQASQLRNNHSFSDHSNSHLFPGYNDCDSWENIINDGWSASYGVTMPVRSEQDGRRLIQEVERLWKNQGYEVNVQTSGDSSTRLWFDTDYARVQFNVDWNEATIRGTTICLSPR
jgi:hypothetical protein